MDNTMNTATIRRSYSGRAFQLVMVEPGGRNHYIGTEYTFREAVAEARTLGLARLFVRPSLASNMFGWHEIDAR